MGPLPTKTLPTWAVEGLGWYMPGFSSFSAAQTWADIHGGVVTSDALWQ